MGPTGPTGHTGAEEIMGPTGPGSPATTVRSTDIARRTTVSTVSEPSSLVTVREISTWCARCRDFRMPIISEENWAGVACGAAVGLGITLATVTFPTNSTDKVFIEVAFGAAVLIFFAFGSLAFVKRKKAKHDLARLADDMDGACQAGRAEILTSSGQDAAAARSTMG